MAQQPTPAVENHFIAGLKTEFTGLNFPENAATDTQNCVYTLIGDVLRREGFNYEANAVFNALTDRTGVALSKHKWKNVGGDGLTEVFVFQVGNTVFFFRSTDATIANPLSTTILVSTVTLSAFTSLGGVFNPAVECQFTDGNGYLFIFHPNIDPVYCTYSSGVITPFLINLMIRDFAGIPEPNVADNFRPNTLTPEHTYNLVNQGWTAGPPWTATISSTTGGATVGSSLTAFISSQTNTTSVSNGSTVQVTYTNNLGSMVVTGTVTSYSTPFTTLVMTVTSISNQIIGGNPPVITAALVNVGFIQTWFSGIGNFPSNSDIWWLYKNTSNLFSPTTTITNVQQPFGPAPKGSFILNAFNQQRTKISGTAGLTDVITTVRPKTGAWFQGRVFYAGVDASFTASGDEPFQTWTENIYFSQIVINTTQFGRCYQTNDPTSENLFAILPSDGGVITIQGSGSIFKVFALENGLLVFAANGIWFITGSQGIGFAANDYTVRKISNIQNISATSFINVNGYPMFWNEEGIYSVVPAQQGQGLGQNSTSFQVNNLCLGSILTVYQNIPKQSKKFARGDYDIINYTIQWCYRSTNESSVTDRYQFDTILNLNTVTQAFYPYTFANTPLSNGNTPFINDVVFMQNPGGTGTPSPVFKYPVSVKQTVGYKYTFAEERDITFVDWFSEDNLGLNFTSFFTTGYKPPGTYIRKAQLPYLYLFFRNNPLPNGCFIQSIWDYASDPNSGKWSVKQIITNMPTSFGMTYRRIRLRGRGLVLQLKVTSVPGQPFDIMGWSSWNVTNTGI
jgi:hypothetical protein